MSNFHPLEVVVRGSEPQLQVGENSNKITCTKELSILYEMRIIKFNHGGDILKSEKYMSIKH